MQRIALILHLHPGCKLAVRCPRIARASLQCRRIGRHRRGTCPNGCRSSRSESTRPASVSVWPWARSSARLAQAAGASGPARTPPGRPGGVGISLAGVQGWAVGRRRQAPRIAWVVERHPVAEPQTQLDRGLAGERPNVSTRRLTGDAIRRHGRLWLHGPAPLAAGQEGRQEARREPHPTTAGRSACSAARSKPDGACFPSCAQSADRTAYASSQ
jgi:hypothetical protein